MVGPFIDGDDLCRDCGLCCHDVTGLRVTEEELVRLPRLAPFVTSVEGPFRLLDVPGPCPYLGSDMRCTVFEQRPFDCSLYPLNIKTVTTVTTVGVRGPGDTIEARWNFGGAGCPHRPEFVAIARHQDMGPVRDWVARSTGADRVVLRTTRWERVRAALTVWLFRVHLLAPVRAAVRGVRSLWPRRR